MDFKIKNPKLDSVNPHFKSRYASLGEVLRVVNEGLPKDYHIKQTVLDGNFVTTVFKGDTPIKDASFPFPQTGKAQELGSALTYSRRYSLCLLFNLVGEEDDDGNACTLPPKKKTKKEVNDF